MRFTPKDIEVVRNGLSFLTFLERQILIYRFWEERTIEDIAEILEMYWDEVDSYIEDSLKSLRKYCLEHPSFSLGVFMEAA